MSRLMKCHKCVKHMPEMRKIPCYNQALLYIRELILPNCQMTQMREIANFKTTAEVPTSKLRLFSNHFNNSPHLQL